MIKQILEFSEKLINSRDGVMGEGLYEYDLLDKICEQFKLNCKLECEEVYDVDDWDKTMRYVYKLYNDEIKYYVEVMEVLGNTDMQPNEGVTEIAQVFPRKIVMTVYERDEE